MSSTKHTMTMMLCVATFSGLVNAGVMASDDPKSEKKSEPVVDMKDEMPAMPEPMVSLKRKGGSGKKSSKKSGVITVEPGVNEILPIAISHVNRIIVPFVPTISTYSTANIEVKENVIVVGTNDPAPVTMFITPKGSRGGTAISLTLAPKEIPPAQYTLRLSDRHMSEIEFVSDVGGRGGRGKTAKNEPYVQSITRVLRGIALGDIPQGYTFKRRSYRDPLPKCKQPGVRYSFSRSQVVSNGKLTVVIGTATNVSGRTLEVSEQACSGNQVAAAAYWPDIALSPNKKTEVYVVFRKESAKAKSRRSRPSLL